MKPFLGRLFLQERVPGAAEGVTQPDGRGDEDVGLPGFDLLQGADVEFGQFGEFFLGHFPRHAFAAQVGPEDFDLAFLFVGRGFG